MGALSTPYLTHFNIFMIRSKFMDPETSGKLQVDVAAEDLPAYEPPRVLTYRGEDIINILGPAQTCTSGAQGFIISTPSCG